MTSVTFKPHYSSHYIVDWFVSAVAVRVLFYFARVADRFEAEESTQALDTHGPDTQEKCILHP